jgi:SAM-dependent methyltransferase
MTEAETLKSCCADLYATDWARLLLGDSLHPGGAALTDRLGRLMGLRPGSRVLDVAAGQGASARYLAERLGCRVVGAEYSPLSAGVARDVARECGLDHQVAFLVGDAERLPCAGAAFDAVLCECAYCTFPDKAAAAAELARVLRPGGAAGLADLVRRGPLPAGLDDLLAWVSCIADARPLDEYVRHLEAAGLEVATVEDHDEALIELVRAVSLRLAVATAAGRLRQVLFVGVDLSRAHHLARSAERAASDGSLGYALIVARKPA